MKKGDYVVIQEWMISELGLKGNELLIYALVYSFSRDGESEFKGSINYIEKWVGVARNTVKNILKILVEKKLISKRDFSKNNIRYCAYKAIRKNDVGVGQILPQGGAIFDPVGGAIFDPNKYKVYKHKDKKEDTIVSKKESELEVLFDSFRKKYKRYGGKARGLQVELDNFKKKHKDWREVIPMLDYALEKENEEREQATMRGDFFPVMKNLQTYINQRSWEVYSEGFEDYDPNEYHPADLKYDPKYNAYRFYGISPQLNLYDGYTDEDRPNGARVVEQFNVYVWRSDIKDWERVS